VFVSRAEAMLRVMNGVLEVRPGQEFTCTIGAASRTCTANDGGTLEIDLAADAGARVILVPE